MKIFNEFSWNAVDNILSIVFKFILIAYVTKELGFEQYGLISYGGIGAAISIVLSLVLANLACFLLIPLMCEYRKIFMQGLFARNSYKANFGILFRVVLGER